MVERLLFIFNYEGQRIVTEEDFMKTMTRWSVFSANDINNDNFLDVRELKMMIWLLQGKKPNQAMMLRECKIMDAD